MSLASATLPAPAAARLRRPTWRDPKLLVGVVLVLAAVALGARAVSAADETVPVWAARNVLSVGTPLTADELTVARVRLGDAGEHYLSADGPPPSGLVLLRAVQAGELLPATAVGPADSFTRRPVVIPVLPPLAVGLRPGAVAEIWVALPKTSGGRATFGEPELLVEAADIRSVTAAEGALAASSPSGVEVMLEERDLPAVLDALAKEASVALVPIPGSDALAEDR